MIYAAWALTLPVGQFRILYQLATCKASPMEIASLPWVPSFLQRHRVRPDMEIGEVSLNLRCDRSLVRAEGTNSLKTGAAWVRVQEGFLEKDPAACRWAMKQSIGHIKHDMRVRMLGVSMVCQVATAVFSMMVLPVIPALALTHVVGLGSLILLTLRREQLPDQFACETSSKRELRGGIRYLTALQQESGPAGAIYGSLGTRIQTIQKKLGTHYSPPQEEIDRIRDLMAPIRSGGPIDQLRAKEGVDLPRFCKSVINSKK